MTDQALQAALDKKVGKTTAPPLGQGPIGPVTQEHVDRCNEWLRPLAARDGFSALLAVTADDIEGMLKLGSTNMAYLVPDNIREADAVRTLLLVDIGNVKKVIRWGVAPQDEEPTTEMRCRLTARGRRMLQQCCPDLWDQMLYGRKK